MAISLDLDIFGNHYFADIKGFRLIISILRVGTSFYVNHLLSQIVLKMESCDSFDSVVSINLIDDINKIKTHHLVFRIDLN